ncbi:LOW QUALITY PROTEIN: semaphorin-4E-like [Hippocampus zosterae]|uniref:LOW QUALITY PROTEIN: semaphorin-4E-like n=1 Tax=Hippocampus zosterae TaxID=109293 RepID=UPI00223CC80E|nr:LOW QUALITY PROTEIN: semaphorin-4E-like [Hippocampus zosterae]
MLPVLFLRIVCGLMLYASFCEPDTQPCLPRKTVSLQDLNTFSKDGIYNYNTMLIMEHLGVLVVAARDAIFALELNNISVKMAEVDWPVTGKSECMRRHPKRELNCHNYIRTLHKVYSTRMFVCGFNAFNPQCDSLTYDGGQLKLMGKLLEGQGRTYYLLFEGYASVMVGEYLGVLLWWTSTKYLKYFELVIHFQESILLALFLVTCASHGTHYDHLQHFLKITPPRYGTNTLCCVRVGLEVGVTQERLVLLDLTAAFDTFISSDTFCPLLENGFIQKAVNHNGETFIIEEIQVYPTERIRTLHLFSIKGQLFVGSRVGVVQMPVSNCSRHDTGLDCILARDPYCAWNLSAKVCFPIRGLSSSPTVSTAIQSLKEVFKCPKHDPVPVVYYRLVPGINMQLTCQATSNLAQVLWWFANETLNSKSKYSIHSQGLIILNTFELDAGLYTCNSSELINGILYSRRVAAYRIQVDCCGSPNSVFDCFLGPTFLVPLVLLFLLCLTLVTFIIWTWRRCRYMVQQTDNTELMATSQIRQN